MTTTASVTRSAARRHCCSSPRCWRLAGGVLFFLPERRGSYIRAGVAGAGLLCVLAFVFLTLSSIASEMGVGIGELEDAGIVISWKFGLWLALLGFIAAAALQFVPMPFADKEHASGRECRQSPGLNGAHAGRLQRRNGGLRLTNSSTPPALSLHGALNNALAYGDISQGRIIEAHPTTAWRWVKTAVKRAEELGAITPEKRIGTHTLRHSYARHLLLSDIPVNYLSRWLGHSSIRTTLIYLKVVPDPDGEFGDGVVS